MFAFGLERTVFDIRLAFKEIIFQLIRLNPLPKENSIKLHSVDCGLDTERDLRGHLLCGQSLKLNTLLRIFFTKDSYLVVELFLCDRKTDIDRVGKHLVAFAILTVYAAMKYHITNLDNILFTVRDKEILFHHGFIIQMFLYRERNIRGAAVLGIDDIIESATFHEHRSVVATNRCIHRRDSTSTGCAETGVGIILKSNQHTVVKTDRAVECHAT